MEDNYFSTKKKNPFPIIYTNNPLWAAETKRKCLTVSPSSRRHHVLVPHVSNRSGSSSLDAAPWRLLTLLLLPLLLQLLRRHCPRATGPCTGRKKKTKKTKLEEILKAFLFHPSAPQQPSSPSFSDLSTTPPPLYSPPRARPPAPNTDNFCLTQK